MLLTVSCGDLFTKLKKQVSTTQFATCKLDTQAFANIFVENIKGDIECLRENLNLFMDVVRSDRPGTLSLKELKIYLEKNIPEIDHSLLKALPAIFEVNALMFADDKNYISRTNVEKLIKFLIVLNKEAVDKEIYKFFMDNEKITYSLHQERRHLIYTSVFNLSKILENYLVKDRQAPTIIHIPSFLDYFRNGENDRSIDQVLEFLFGKKAILGGNEREINNVEFENLITKVADIAKVLYDIKNLKQIKYSENELLEKLKMYKADIVTLETALFYPRGSHEPLFDLNQVKAIIGQYLPSFSKYLKYDDVLKNAKDFILGSNSAVFSANEVYILLDHLSYMIEEGEYFQVIYNQYRDELASNDYVNLSGEEAQANYLTDRQKEFFNNFIRIVKNYRFFKGEGYIPYFANDITRTSQGVYEIAIFEYAIKVALKKYGVFQNGEYYITQELLTQLLQKYSSILIGERIIYEGRIKNTAETITLLTTLFQNQSNGDGLISVAELTEFVMTLFSAHRLASDMAIKMRESSDPACEIYRPTRSIFVKNQTDIQEMFDPSCFRKEFGDFLTTVVSDQERIESYLAKFTDYYLNSNLTYQEQENFLKKTEIFSRTCTVYNDGTEVQMEEGDLFVIFAGLLNLEQTYLRFDTDKDNILSPSELEVAYGIYGSAVEGLVPIKVFKSWLAKNFYLYMIKYKEIPNIDNINSLKDAWRAAGEGGKFALFALGLKQPKYVEANRETLASILKVLGELSPEAKNNPFDCETLRPNLSVDKKNLSKVNLVHSFR